MLSGVGVFEFFDPGVLRDEDLLLTLSETLQADTARGWAPCYMFHMINGERGRKVGEIQLRIGFTEHLRLYAGHIGYSVEADFRGHRFAARSIQLLMPLARKHGFSELWITCNPENTASRRTCEIAGATFVEILDLPADTEIYQRGDRQKCRYLLSLK